MRMSMDELPLCARLLPNMITPCIHAVIHRSYPQDLRM